MLIIFPDGTPMFNSRSVGAGNSYLQFPSYASGEYIKFTAPVAGVYMFDLMCSWETHAGGVLARLLLVGKKIQIVMNKRFAIIINGQYASGVFTRTSVDGGNWSDLQTIMWMDTNDYAVLYQQSCKLSVGDQMKLTLEKISYKLIMDYTITLTDTQVKAGRLDMQQIQKMWIANAAMQEHNELQKKLKYYNYLQNIVIKIVFS